MKTAVFLFFLMAVCTPGIAQILFQYDSTVAVSQEGILLENAWAGGLNAGQYGRIDMNGDQIEDLVVFDRSSRSLNTFILVEDKFIFSPDYRAFFPAEIEGWILFRDYDCDGRKDIFANAERGMKAYRNVTSSGGKPEWELIADPVLTLTTSGMINLQVNVTDVPAIDDIDGDGDLDILVYNFAIGGFIRHHQNMSVEKTGSCGTLDYELVSRNWGYFEECDCMLYAFEEFGESCEDFAAGRVMHAGGKSLLLIDMDNDGDKDFMGGHEQCDEFYYLENTGSPSEARMISFRTDYPDPEKPASFFIHPAGFLDDFDLDGIRDMIVAPNEQSNIDHRIDFGNSSWFYKNTGTNELPEFKFVTEKFLQSGMIDLGGQAVPVLIDEDGDGDLDLIIGGNGMEYDDVFYGYLRVYENTGDFLDPRFELKSSDYMDLSSLMLYDLIPAFADLNHDGAPDMVLSGTLPNDNSIVTRLYLNSRKAGRGLDFSGSEGILIDLGIQVDDTPFFTDVDRDGLNDMLLGKSTGRLEYHRNTGSAGSPEFVLEEAAFLGIDDDFIDFKRNLVPYVADFDLDGRNDLITSDYTGVLNIYQHYQDDPERIAEIWYNSLLEVSDTLTAGYHTWLTGGLLFADEFPVLITGTESGGLIFYRSASERDVSDNGNLELQVYPNPSKPDDLLNIRTNSDGYVYIYDVLGRLLEVPLKVEGYVVNQFQTGYLPAGTYILKFVDPEGRSVSKQYIRF